MPSNHIPYREGSNNLSLKVYHVTYGKYIARNFRRGS